MAIKVLSVNIEGDKHLDKVIPFIKKQNPDVVFLMEFFEVDFHIFERELKLSGMFFPTCDRKEKISKFDVEPRGLQGVGFFTSLSISQVEGRYYFGKGNSPRYSGPNGQDRVVVVGTVENEEGEYTIGATHFTWAAGGGINDEQRRDLKEMLKVINEEIVLFGDFNAPRGREIFTKLCERFKDNIPPDVTTTLDPDIHRAGPLPYVIDGAFSTPKYKVSKVEVIGGVSDHKAIVCEVEKNE